MIKSFGGYAKIVNVYNKFDSIEGTVEITTYVRIFAADDESLESIKNYLSKKGYTQTENDKDVMKQIKVVKVLE